MACPLPVHTAVLQAAPSNEPIQKGCHEILFIQAHSKG
jgi:hypothetical protein